MTTPDLDKLEGLLRDLHRAATIAAFCRVANQVGDEVSTLITAHRQALAEIERLRKALNAAENRAKIKHQMWEKARAALQPTSGEGEE